MFAIVNLVFLFTTVQTCYGTNAETSFEYLGVLRPPSSSYDKEFWDEEGVGSPSLYGYSMQLIMDGGSPR